MARSKKPSKSRRVDVQDEMAHNPFADKLAGLASVSPEPEPEPEPSKPQAPDTSDSRPQEPQFGPKLILRREKKGRGGKTVTRIEGVLGTQEALDTLARKLGKALGARAFVQDGLLWVSGDQCLAAQAWFNKAGATKIVIGN